jgi:phthalate 4,5-dioxygenase oxygenase subunit
MSISMENNKLLTQVANGAPMGKMLQTNYWIPVLASDDLVADAPPRRVRILGSNYVAFRSTEGRVGFLAESCPHRAVSLTLGRNEENGLRCIFHGWKFDVDGHCVDVPTQVGDAAQFCRKVKVQFGLAREAGGVVWVWLGAQEMAPTLPNFSFIATPESHRKISYQDVPCNWVQGVESNMDSAHVGILHKSSSKRIPGSAVHLQHTSTALAPRYEIEGRPYGFRYAALRDLPDGTTYVRVNAFVAPWYSLICANSADLPSLMLITTPIDDENMRFWVIAYHMTKPITEGAGFYFDSKGCRFPPLPPGNRDDRWGQNRALMADGHWSGFDQHAFTEDFAIMLSQGAIASRTDEQLNSGDQAVVRVRKILLDSVRAHQTNVAPSGRDSDLATVAPIGFITSVPADWRQQASG